jgi:histo-blood group ABO system transferase
MIHFFYIFAIFFYASATYASNVGLLIMATGRYIEFVDPLIHSANNHFCTNHNVTYFVFTDQPFKEQKNVVYIYQDRLGWPFDTMMRYHSYYDARDLFIDQDYLFACDADMLFVGMVGDEILSKQTATIHPGFVDQRGSYETNPLSNAYIAPDEGEYYFAGGFYGGSREEFLHITETNIDKINDDLDRGVIAIWHDESHWNRYCIDNKPTTILSPSYCYPESWNLPYEKKLLALDKEHAAFRQ